MSRLSPTASSTPALFHASDDFGPNTTESVAMCYVGLGLTWRYGGPACGDCQCAESACSCQ